MSKLIKLFFYFKKKHQSRFSGPQLWLWARMNVNGQHESLDTSPNIPIFTGSVPNPKSTRGELLSDALTSAATAVVNLLTDWPGKSPSSAMFPAKRTHVSGQYLDHLEKLKKLYEADILTKEEFEEQKHFTLKSIRQINS